jgi:hypothetical protein
MGSARSGAASLVLLVLCLALIAPYVEARRTRRPPMGPWRAGPAGRVRSGAASPGPAPRAPWRHALERHPLNQCQERWRDATLDHFSWSQPEVPGARTFKQRFYVCAKVGASRMGAHGCARSQAWAAAGGRSPGRLGSPRF